MIKQTITFEDFNGQARTEDFWFHLSKAELVELELANNGFGEYLQRIVSANDGRAIMDEFKNIISMSYGVRSEDGRRFIKSKQLSEEFFQTPAYDQMFVRLVTDAAFGSEFINGLVPADLAASARSEAQQIRRQPQDHQQKAPAQVVQLPENVQPAQQPQNVFQQPQESWTGQPASQTPPPDQGYVQAPPHESGPGYYQGPAQQG